jgi:hypothetical protein
VRTLDSSAQSESTATSGRPRSAHTSARVCGSNAASDRRRRRFRSSLRVLMSVCCALCVFAPTPTIGAPRTKHRDRTTPDVNYTWGVVRPEISRSVACSTRWGRDVRHVDTKMRRAVFAAYGVPWRRRGEFELDHLIPRSLGGADDVHNLWPQPLAEARHLKDPLEVKLGTLVCAGEITLPFAQESIRANWKAAYRLYVNAHPVSR